MRVVVEIERTTGTVQGRIAVGDGSSRGFYGWLELIDGLDRATIPHPAQADADHQQQAT